METREILTELKQRIQKQGIIRYRYIGKSEDGTCQHCAIGHLMDICGINMDSFLEDEDFNFKSISASSGEMAHYLNKLMDSGFNEKDISYMQDLNDDFMVEALIDFIDGKIEELA